MHRSLAKSLAVVAIAVGSVCAAGAQPLRPVSPNIQCDPEPGPCLFYANTVAAAGELVLFEYSTDLATWTPLAQWGPVPSATQLFAAAYITGPFRVPGSETSLFVRVSGTFPAFEGGLFDQFEAVRVWPHCAGIWRVP